MTKEEFEALGITKLDLILIKHYDMGIKYSKWIESRICGIGKCYKRVGHKRSSPFYGLITYNCYRKKHQCEYDRGYIFMENIISLSIIQKDFWK